MSKQMVPNTNKVNIDLNENTPQQIPLLSQGIDASYTRVKSKMSMTPDKTTPKKKASPDSRTEPKMDYGGTCSDHRESDSHRE